MHSHVSTEDLDAADFAEYLQAERERRQLTLEQTDGETNISTRDLAALEHGGERNWPGGMYRRAMMRAYADSIGVDREFALEHSEQAFEAPLTQDTQDTQPPPISELPTAAPRIPKVVVRTSLSPRQLAAAGASMLSIVALAILWNAFSAFPGGGHPEIASAAAVTPAPTVVGTEPPPPAPAPVPAPPAPESLQTRAAAPAPTVSATTGSTPARPLATDATIVVESEPAGARVTVNGVGWGETPITIRHLEFGSKRIRLTRQDYVSEERGILLARDRPSARVNVRLRKR
jgi:cytoskeletal protein RodZ